MNVKLHLRKVLLDGKPALVAVGLDDQAAMNKIPVGWISEVTVRVGHRSRAQENFYRKLVRVVADGVDMAPQVLHEELKFRAGKVLGAIESPVFGKAVVLKSTADMDDAEFKEFVIAAEDIIFRDYLPGVDRAYVHEEVAKLTGAGW